MTTVQELRSPEKVLSIIAATARLSGIAAPRRITFDEPGPGQRLAVLAMSWPSMADMRPWLSVFHIDPHRPDATTVYGDYHGWSLMLNAPDAATACRDCGGDVVHRAGCPSEPEHLADHYASADIAHEFVMTYAAVQYTVRIDRLGSVWFLYGDAGWSKTGEVYATSREESEADARNLVGAYLREHQDADDREAILEALAAGPRELSAHPAEALHAAVRDRVIYAMGRNEDGRTVYVLKSRVDVDVEPSRVDPEAAAQIPVVLIDVTPNPAPSDASALFDDDARMAIDELDDLPTVSVTQLAEAATVEPDAREYVPYTPVHYPTGDQANRVTAAILRGETVHHVPTGLPLLVNGHVPPTPTDHGPVPIVEVTSVEPGPLEARDDNAAMAGVLPQQTSFAEAAERLETVRDAEVAEYAHAMLAEASE